MQTPWAPGGAYRAKFLGDLDSAMRKIFRGIGALSSHELAGERMAVAFESKDQEDEHSCFSDNTNADVVNDLRGIRMVYNGAGPDDDEPNRASVAALVMDEDPELGEKLARALDGSLAKAQAFPATFETMIAAPERVAGQPANRGDDRGDRGAERAAQARRPSCSTSRWASRAEQRAPCRTAARRLRCS